LTNLSNACGRCSRKQKALGWTLTNSAMSQSTSFKRVGSIMTEVKFFHHYFGFCANCLFVEYGDPSIASHSWWIVPGTWEEAYGEY
jgi:hypothetical protein